MLSTLSDAALIRHHAGLYYRQTNGEELAEAITLAVAAMRSRGLI